MFEITNYCVTNLAFLHCKEAKNNEIVEISGISEK